MPTDAPIVHTPSGAVRGFWQRSDIACFRGIPYAQVPTGDLRFARPQKRSAWQGTRDATAYGPTPQRGDQGITRIPEHSVPGDDILSVNVTTPSLDPTGRLPVIVWIHGGGYISGSPASPWYDGSAFARDGVVLVTLSYRLGFTGFGYIDGTVQNRGVLDWICALEWVRDHIASFGGDPNRVTIAGQSAGASAVLTLLGTPAARGLFRGAYAMSAAIADPSLEAAKRRSNSLAHIAKVRPDLDGFASLPEPTLLALQPKITNPAPPHLLHDVHRLLRDGLMIGPIADGEIVVYSSIDEAVSRGDSAGVPLVIGTADDELAGLMGEPPTNPGIGSILDLAPHKATLRMLGVSSSAAERWLADPAQRDFKSLKQLLGRFTTDAVFRSWVPRIANARSACPAAGPTYSYRFSWHAEQPPYAGHCIDIPFAFDRLDAPGVDGVAGLRPPQQLADSVHGALVRFAKTGNPGWPEDAVGQGPSRIFDIPIAEQVGAYASAAALLP